MKDVYISDIPALIYCIKPCPSSLLRSRFKMERIGRLSDAGLIHAADLGIDIYSPGSGGDPIIQISAAGVDYLWRILIRSLLVLAPIAVSALSFIK